MPKGKQNVCISLFEEKNLVYTLVDMSEMLHSQAFLFLLPEVKERRIPLQIKKKVADVQNAK